MNININIDSETIFRVIAVVIFYYIGLYLGETAFLQGMIHGVFLPFRWIMNGFFEGNFPIHIPLGKWYDLGYILGIVVLFSIVHSLFKEDF